MLKNKNIFAITFMLGSTLFLVVSVWGIKKFIQSPVSKAENITDFNLNRVRKVKQKKNKVTKKKKPKLKKKLKSLKPVMRTSLAGNSFGLGLESLDDIGLDEDLIGNDQDIIMDEHSVDSRPVVIGQTGIAFPEKALENDIDKGIVELRMLIDKTGAVTNTQILKASPKGYFEDAAMAMVQGWKFSPAKYQGRSVAIWVKQVVRFGE